MSKPHKHERRNARMRRREEEMDRRVAAGEAEQQRLFDEQTSGPQPTIIMCEVGYMIQDIWKNYYLKYGHGRPDGAEPLRSSSKSNMGAP